MSRLAIPSFAHLRVSLSRPPTLKLSGDLSPGLSFSLFDSLEHYCSYTHARTHKLSVCLASLSSHCFFRRLRLPHSSARIVTVWPHLNRACARTYLVVLLVASFVVTPLFVFRSLFLSLSLSFSVSLSLSLSLSLVSFFFSPSV
jgi:hypothetical protein